MTAESQFEADIAELGYRAACWLAGAADDPEFMLAGLRPREQGDRPRTGWPRESRGRQGPPPR